MEGIEVQVSPGVPSGSLLPEQKDSEGYYRALYAKIQRG